MEIIWTGGEDVGTVVMMATSGHSAHLEHWALIVKRVTWEKGVFNAEDKRIIGNKM